jgi:hypothetical protein
MGKWSNLRGKYPELPYDDAMAQAINDLSDMERQDLTEEVNELRGQKEELERQLKDVNFAIDAHEAALIRKMDATGLDSFATGGYLWTRSEEPHPRVVDRNANVQWALRYEPDVLSVQWQSLKALTKQALEHPGNAEAMPAGIEIYMKPVLSRRRKS